MVSAFRRLRQEDQMSLKLTQVTGNDLVSNKHTLPTARHGDKHAFNPSTQKAEVSRSSRPA